MGLLEEERIKEVVQRLETSKRVLVLTGAGISKDSGIQNSSGNGIDGDRG